MQDLTDVKTCSNQDYTCVNVNKHALGQTR